jgi:hypothetical protein
LKKWKSLDPRKQVANTPQSTSNSPSKHHKLAIKKHRFSQNPLQKHQQKREKSTPALPKTFFLKLEKISQDNGTGFHADEKDEKEDRFSNFGDAQAKSIRPCRRNESW